jgi:hypothetical protein
MPKNKFVLEDEILIWLLTAPALLLSVTLALEVVMVWIDNTIVPLKSEVGVITNVSVVVARGPTAPVAVNAEDVNPPKATVNDPAVLPVTV